jgi:hypothetical protein
MPEPRIRACVVRGSGRARARTPSIKQFVGPPGGVNPQLLLMLLHISASLARQQAAI